MQRERDGARAAAAPLQAPLSALPVPFEFGGFSSNPPPRSVPPPVPPPHHPSPSFHPLGLAPWHRSEEEETEERSPGDAVPVGQGLPAEPCRAQQGGQGQQRAEGGE